MFVLFSSMTGPSSGDWLGYAELYSDQGGWLLDQKRDPGFLLVLSGAHFLFGRYGYPEFRIMLSVIFVFFAIWLVYSMPIQTRLGWISSIATALVVACAFSLKGFVQIREGLAFLFIFAPMVGMFGNRHRGLLVSGFGTVAALAFHSGATVLAVTWVIALALMTLRDEALASRTVHTAMLLVGIIAGACIGAFTIYHADEIRYFLGSYGVNVHAKTVGNLAKDLYWVLAGLLSIKIRNDLMGALVGTTRFGYCLGSAVASFAIPLMYAICVTLVLSRFETPALTSMMIRVFFTVTELAMIIIALRGRLNFATTAIAAFMFVDRLRVAAESS